MKNIYILSVLLLLLASCTNRPQRESATVEEIALYPDLVWGVLQLVDHETYLNFPEIPIEESFIIVQFSVNSRERGGVVYLDSIVGFSHFNNYFSIHCEGIGYKGMLNIEGYNVAIFDPYNFGYRFFNIDSLQQIPLEGFKPFPAENVTVEEFRLYNGKLKSIGRVLVTEESEDGRWI